jgi:AcrR family transcriptional regulator
MANINYRLYLHEVLLPCYSLALNQLKVRVNMPDIKESPQPEAAPKPNRMDKRRLETRAKLLKATLSLVVEKGIEKTTMDDITETADLGRRTLYYHFDSKDECVIAAVALAYGEIAKSADRTAHEYTDPAMTVAVAMQMVIREVLHAPVTARLVEYPRFLAAALKDAISEYVYGDLAVGLEQGRFDPLLDDKLLDTHVLWTLVGFVIDALDQEKAVDIDETLGSYTAFLLVVLGLSKAEAEQITASAAKLSP